MTRITSVAAIVIASGLVAAVAACGGGSSTASSLPQGSEQVSLDPADFTTEIDNRYWPMAPGNRWVFRETNAEGAHRRVVVTVTDQTKTIMGIDAVVVHDTVTEQGVLVEDTYDWYAQDADGNIWYLGEDTKEYANGKVATTAGSWQAGVDGAQPGIVVAANPEPGMSYREEYYAGQAEDAARVLAIDEKVEVPYGFYQGVLLTQNVTALDPKVAEHKFYVKGIGPVREISVSGGSDETELVHFTRAS
jgi:hypothetical protein